MQHLLSTKKRKKILCFASAVVVGSLFASISCKADPIYIDGIDFGGSFIDKYDVNGVSTFAVPQPPQANPGSMALDSSGNLFVAINATGTIQEFDPAGIGKNFATGLAGLSGLAFDISGNLYTATSDGGIHKFTPAGVDTLFATNLPGTIQNLAFDKQGNLYASSSSTGQILKIDTNGNVSTFSVNLSLNQPFGLAFDGDDNLYVSNFGDNTIDKFGTDGVGSVFAGASANLSGPISLAFDSSGNLYVVNRIDKVPPFYPIDEFAPNGNESLFANGLNPGGIAILVPEPSSLLLAVTGLLVLAAAVKRRRA